MKKQTETKEQERLRGFATRWLKEISQVQESKAQKNFERVGEKVVKKYSAQSDLEAFGGTSGARQMFNILHSNVEVLSPALFARIPKTVVERRFKDNDPIALLASLACERATQFQLDIQKERLIFGGRAVVKDRLLPGRGVMWGRYEAQFQETDNEGASGADKGPEVADEAVEADEVEPGSQEIVAPNSERIIWDYVHWKDYLEAPARTPFEVRWRARRDYLTRSQLVKRFGEDIGRRVSLQADGRKDKNLSDEEREFLRQAEVWTIADKEGNQTIWVSDGYKDGPLDVQPDNLHLSGYYPLPDPLLATTTTDSSYPIADFVIYARMADELESVCQRESAIMECIRVVGAHAAALNDKIKNITELDDGATFPIENWQQFSERGGIAGAINWFPFDQAVAALPSLREYKAGLLNDIGLITGIADIAQGSTDPNETADAQQRKSHWMVAKLRNKAEDVQRFWRQICSITAEMIFEPGLFSDETISLMVGVSQMTPEQQQNWPNALALLRSDRLRTFRVDIQTDSTIAVDEEIDQQSRMAYLGAINQLVGNIQSVAQFRPELMGPMIDSAMFAIRAFRTGKAVEGSWQKAMEDIEKNDKAAAENPPQPPPDPNMIAAQAKAQEVQIKAQESQAQQQLDVAKFQYEQQKCAEQFQLDSQKMQMDFELAIQKLAIDGAKVQDDKEHKATMLELKTFQEQFKQQSEAILLGLEQKKVEFGIVEHVAEEKRLAREQSTEEMKALTDVAYAETDKHRALTERIAVHRDRSPDK